MSGGLGGLVGGVVGAVIGFTFGNPQLGWLVGSAIGGLVSPKSQKPPGLEDLRPQTSEYGRPIPIVYSIMALAGNVIWAQDLIKTSDGSTGGGKGGGGDQPTAPTYAANFAVLICESPGGVMRLGRIWAGPDKRLVYTPVGGKTESGTLRFYSGAEDQMPDPLIEADLGAGQVPAYRGYAYLVWEGFDVTAFDGNRIPFLTVEVGREGMQAPATLGQFWAEAMYQTTDKFITVYHGTYFGILVNNKADMTLAHDFTIDIGEWGNDDCVIIDYTRYAAIRMHRSAVNHYYVTDLTTGSRVTRDITLGTGESLTSLCMANDAVVVTTNFNRIIQFNADNGVQMAEQTITLPGGESIIGIYTVNQDVSSAFVITQTNVYMMPIDGVSVIPVNIGANSSGFTGSIPRRAMIDPTTQYLWIGHMVGTDGGDPTIKWSVHSSSALVHAGTYVSTYFSVPWQIWTFTPTNVWMIGQRWLSIDHYLKFDQTTGELLEELDGIYHGISHENTVMWDLASGKLTAIRENGTYSVTPGATTNLPDIPYITGGLTGQDSSLQKMTLAQIVADLCERAGMSSDQYDVTQLTDIVDGYTIANQVTVKDAIASLMQVYFFDGVEDQGVLRFIKRGQGIMVQIPDDDLGAHAVGSDGLDLLESTRSMDEELPRTLSVNYVLEATNYSPATKYARRLIGYSGDEARVDFPMVMSDEKALQVAVINLHEVWMERIKHHFFLGNKYAYLMPTDVIGIQGHTIKITNQKSKDGIYEFEGVRDDSDTYVPHVIVEETPPPDQEVQTKSLTLLELM